MNIYENFYNSNILEKKTAYGGSCSISNECGIGTNMVCLGSICTCSNPNLNFWNGTYCGK